MNFPICVKCVAVFTAIRPVTQTADIEVKKASTKEMPCRVEKGSFKATDPISINAIKLKSILLTGESSNLKYLRNIYSGEYDISISSLTNWVITIESHISRHTYF